jgi:hypothetical protein
MGTMGSGLLGTRRSGLEADWPQPRSPRPHPQHPCEEPPARPRGWGEGGAHGRGGRDERETKEGWWWWGRGAGQGGIPFSLSLSSLSHELSKVVQTGIIFYGNNILKTLLIQEISITPIERYYLKMIMQTLSVQSIKIFLSVGVFSRTLEF